MKRNEAGAAVIPESDLSPNWHLQLENHQLAAYLRYQFVRFYENEADWDAPVHNRRRTTWDGGTDRYGVRHKAVWTNIARLVRECRADPGLWVAAHFSGVQYAKQIAQTHTVPDMRPSRLNSAQSPGVYQEYLQALPKMLKHSFDVAGATIANRIRGTQNLNMSPDDQVFYVLCDEGYVSASPFFRHAFADQLGCVRGVERYLWHAALDYEAQQRIYNTSVEPWCITDALRAATLDIRKHWREFA
jgi:hypothetical protein